MRSYTKVQILAIIGTLFICVLLYFAPNKPENKKRIEIDSVDAKIEKAVSLVSGNEPMKGIMLLREILEEDSTNVKANFQLGLFSIQSRQYDKAVIRFNKVLEVNKDFTTARFYLGLAYFNLGESQNALTNFELYLASADDENMKTEAKKYIYELKN